MKDCKLSDIMKECKDYDTIRECKENCKYYDFCFEQANTVPCWWDIEEENKNKENKKNE